MGLDADEKRDFEEQASPSWEYTVKIPVVIETAVGNAESERQNDI